MVGTYTNNAANQASPGIQSLNTTGVFNGRTITGTTGQIAVSNGDGISANPTLSLDFTPAVFSPNSVVTIFEDFLNITPFNINAALYNPISSGITSTNPGVYLDNNGQTSSSVYFSSTTNDFTIGGGVINCNWVVSFAALSDSINNYNAYIGSGDYVSVNNGSPPTFGIYFQYNDLVNFGNWQCICKNGSGTTVVNTSVAAATGFHNYGFIVNAAGTSVDFYIDGIKVNASSLITNIPTNFIPVDYFISNNGVLPNLYIDLFYASIVLTIPR